jgi:hypothetical protein
MTAKEYMLENITPFPNRLKRSPQKLNLRNAVPPSAESLAHFGRDTVPEKVRELSASELEQLSVFEKALVGLTFTMRNLDARAISLQEAEQQAAETLSTLQKLFPSK